MLLLRPCNSIFPLRYNTVPLHPRARDNLVGAPGLYTECFKVICQSLGCVQCEKIDQNLYSGNFRKKTTFTLLAAELNILILQ